MKILLIICAMILSAGVSVRFVYEIGRKKIRPIAIFWKAIEILALAYLFNYFV